MTTQVMNIIDRDELKQIEKEQLPAYEAAVEQFTETSADAVNYFTDSIGTDSINKIAYFIAGAVFALVLTLVIKLI